MIFVFSGFNKRRKYWWKLLKTLRKIKFIGHTTKNNRFIPSILEGNVFGKQDRGRPRKKFLEDNHKRRKCGSYLKIKRMVRDRGEHLYRQGIVFRTLNGERNMWVSACSVNIEKTCRMCTSLEYNLLECIHSRIKIK